MTFGVAFFTRLHLPTLSVLNCNVKSALHTGGMLRWGDLQIKILCLLSFSESVWDLLGIKVTTILPQTCHRDKE